METSEDHQKESRRLAALLLLLVRLSGRNVRSIEEQLGVGNGALGKVLNGTVRLQVEHILLILDVLGITPAQFFHRAYSREERVKPHPLDDLLNESRGHEITEEEETRRTEKIVRRVIRDIFGKAMSDPEPSGD